MIANLAVKRGVTAKTADPKRELTQISSRPLRVLILNEEWLNADLIARMML